MESTPFLFLAVLFSALGSFCVFHEDLFYMDIVAENGEIFNVNLD